jgi:hypothetical protein
MRATCARLALAAAVAAGAPAYAADPEVKAVTEELNRLRDRVEQLEKRNAELERRGGAPAAGGVEGRVRKLEEEQRRVEEGLSREEISEKEPELTSRLKAVEYQALNMQEQARAIEGLKGITVGVSFTTVAQWPSDVQTPAGSDLEGRFRESQLNYRGDIFVGVPLDDIGDIKNRLFASFRVGQGIGLNDLYSFSKPNASAFRVTSVSPDDSVAILGQAWYQATIPLPFQGFKPHSKENLELNFGKMDPFVFFDQNASANDETRQFLNTVFVHNPLLDAGGDIGVDANGFAPGFRASYLNYTDKREPWRVSLGVFGAGPGASYSNFFASTLTIAQFEKQLQLAAGLPGNYRIYAWHNTSAPAFTGGFEKRSGVGLSVDQRVADETTLFARYGQGSSGAQLRFDRAFTFGAEFRGASWDRGGDSLGLAYGWLRTSSAFRTLSATVDADQNGVPDFGFTASGAEQVFEAYYRLRVNRQFEVSPDYQYIVRPAGSPDASPIHVAGVRVQITY